MNGPPVIPDHSLLRPIGRGAYGEVWLARNVMGALRAVKLIWRQQFDSARPYEREFAGIQRYEPVSRSSGGLVHVLHVGQNQAEGYFYYVMELADPVGTGEDGNGKPAINANDDDVAAYEPRTLRSDLRRIGRLPTADCIRLALDLVSGLAQLHRLGLVHRDVKPGNVIYVHGRAKLADIGLVSVREEGRTFVGTEGYIPPEGPGSSAADLYALGVALYEASTGHSPDRFPDVPHEWLTEVAGGEALEFHEIILKACEGRRENRYQSAESLQADLALLQSGQSVRRVRALERRAARLRLSGGIVTVLLACSLIVAFFSNYRARLAAASHAKETRLREQTQNSLARAESAERDARQQLYTALFEQARAKVRSGELGQRVSSLEALRRAGAISNSPALRGAAMSALALPDLRLDRELGLPPDSTLVEFDPAFARYATARGPSPVEIRSVKDQQLIATLPASTNLPAYGAQWNRQGTILAVGRDLPESRLRNWEIWDVAAERCALQLPGIGALAFHPFAKQIVIATESAIEFRDLDSGTVLRQFDPGTSPTQLTFSPDGSRVAAVEWTGKTWQVTIYDSANGRRKRTQPFVESPGYISWHPGNRWLGVPDFSGQVSLLDSHTGQMHPMGRHKLQAVFTTFSPDGDYLLSGGWERELICWDVRTMQRSFTAPLNSFVAQFSADGRRCMIMTRTPSLQLCTFEQPVVQRELPEDLGPRVAEGAISADGHWLAASGAERLAVWDLHGRAPATMVTNARETRLAFASNGELFANRRGAAFRWEITSTTAEATLALKPLPLTVPEKLISLSLVSNGIALTALSGSMLIQLDSPSRAPREWRPTIGGLNGASPDGRWLAMYRSFTARLFVYGLPEIDPAATLNVSSPIHSFQFSPRNDELAVACRDQVEFWSTTTWQLKHVITNHNHVLYSPDGPTMWLSSDFRGACLYDTRTASPLLPLPAGTFPLALSPDGGILAVSVDGRRLQLWNLAEARAQLARLNLDWE
jgi:WD40 repeat protein